MAPQFIGAPSPENGEEYKRLVPFSIELNERAKQIWYETPTRDYVLCRGCTSVGNLWPRYLWFRPENYIGLLKAEDYAGHVAEMPIQFTVS